VPQGGNTSLVGGATPDASGNSVILNLSRLNRVRALDPLNDTITVEAGVVLADLQAAAKAALRLFPLSIGSQGSCQIGGALSTNAGGHAVLRYGVMRDLTLGLEVVLASGEVWQSLRGLRKDNTGYDLKQLFIGAEGTLGVITAAALRLYPLPAQVATALAPVRDVAAAVELLALAKAMSGDRVTAFELIPGIGIEMAAHHVPGVRNPFAQVHEWQVLIELSGGAASDGEIDATMLTLLGRASELGLCLDAAIAASTAQAQALWKIRECLPEAQTREGASIKCDISVPISKIAEFIAKAGAAVGNAQPGARLVAFGHVGDGNVHFNHSRPLNGDDQSFLDRWQDVTGIVHQIALDLGGSISAEHGVGQLKREAIAKLKSATEMGLMRAVKAALDPANIMNPGKVI
jgi:FAD/FMN-containing dehydrogenase